MRLTWTVANDDKTPAAELRYRVYVSTRPGRATSRPAVVTSEPGATSTYVAVAPTEVTHFVVVRAVDGDGNEDANSVEKSVKASADTTPPVFAGVKSTRPEAGGGVTLSWDPATDDFTPPEGMRYLVLDEGGSTLAVLAAKTEVTLQNLGAPGEKRRLLVRAVDAADNVDANTVVADAVLGPDAAPPTFDGCGGVEILGSKVMLVSWPEAKDNATPHSKMTYEVFVATAAGGQDFAAPTTKVVGQTSTIVRGLTPSTDQHVVCRARDESGNTDTNTSEKVGRTMDNVAPPTFAGGAATIAQDTRVATLTWTAAADDTTSPDKIVYAIYEARGTSPFDFTAPRAVTAPGATSIDIAELPSRTTLRWVVRARDQDYNEDQNTVESGGTTLTSWSLDVIPVFEQNCSVVGCHVAPVSIGGLSLSAYNAYESIVGVNANQKPPGPDGGAGPTLKRVDPFNSATSYLYVKVVGAPGTITGNAMPAPGTGTVLSTSQKEILKTWIDQGALRN